MLAAANHSVEIVHHILAAKVNAKNEDQQYSTNGGSIKGDADIVQILLNAGADINAR